MLRGKKSILSVQSQVATGYVGNNIASLAIQLHGLNPIQIPTVLLSNHIEYPEVYGQPLVSDLFRDLLKGVEKNHILSQCNFLISGFFGSLDLIQILSEFISQTKKLLGYQFVYDPVCGDFRAGGLYLPKNIADYSITNLLPLCNIVTPNHFELEFIIGHKVRTLQEILEAISIHHVLSSKKVVITGISFDDTPDDIIEVVLYEKGVLRRFQADRIPVEVIGAGDLFTAIITAQLHFSANIDQAIKKAMTYMSAVLETAFEEGNEDFDAAILLKHIQLLG